MSTFYRDMLEKWQTAMLERNIETFFHHSVETRQKMYTQYKSLGSIEAFTKWLSKEAADEAAGVSSGSLSFFVAGGD